jgi:hypothetical protein
MSESEMKQTNLREARTRFSEVRQAHTAWCIPAGLEVILHYVGIAVSQDNLVLAYCRRHGDSALVRIADGRSVMIGAMSDEERLDAARVSRFKEGDFGSFKAAVMAVVDLEQKGYELFHPTNRSSCEENLRMSICQGDPCLLAGESPDGSFHIYAIAGFDGQRFHAYEPWEGRFHLKTLTEINSNCDSLVLRRRSATDQPNNAADDASRRR